MDTILITQNLSTSTKFAVGSFIIGTFLFLYNLLFPNDAFFLLGFFYVIFAVIFNLMILVNLLYQLIIDKPERQTNLVRILIILANIPIAYFYSIITFNH